MRTLKFQIKVQYTSNLNSITPVYVCNASCQCYCFYVEEQLSKIWEIISALP